MVLAPNPLHNIRYGVIIGEITKLLMKLKNKPSRAN